MTSDPALSSPSRFSLKTLFLAVLFVAMGLALFVTMRELLALRRENSLLRAEAGHLTVEDPQKAAVPSIRTLDELTWRWKVHLPPGQWFLHSVTRNIPDKGLPALPDPSHATTWGPNANGPLDLPIDAS